MLYCILRLTVTITFTSNQTNFLTYPYVQAQAQPSEEISDLSYPLHPLQPRFPLDSRPRSPILGPFDVSKGTSTGLLSPSSSNASPSSMTSVPSGTMDLVCPQSRGSKLQSINDRVAAPYDYTEGYHFLMKHLPIRCVIPWNVSAESDTLLSLLPCSFRASHCFSIVFSASRRTTSCGSYGRWQFFAHRSLRSKCHCPLTMRYLWRSVSSDLCW